MASPAVDRASERILAGIREGHYPRGKALPGERSLCVELAVSRATLRSAFARLAELGQLVLRPNCQPLVPFQDPQQRNVPKAHYIALWLWPAFEEYGAASIAKGIQKALRRSDFRLYIPNTSGVHWPTLVEEEQQFLDKIATDEDASGLIFWPVGGSNNLVSLTRLREAKKPIVFIDRLPPDGFEADFVGTDNLGSSRAVIEHLLGLGHRRIAYVSNSEDVSSVSDRVEGYLQALDDAAVEFDPNLLVQLRTTTSERHELTASRLVGELLAISNPPTAIATVNDSVALLVQQALINAGVRVPEDISLAGFDGILRWVPGSGQLTTAEQAFERIGEVAGRLLLDRISSGQFQPYRHTLIDAPCREAGSTWHIDRLPSLGFPTAGALIKS